MQASFYIVFNRRNKLNKSGKGILEYVISIKGKRKFVTAGYSLKPQEWDEKKKRVTAKHRYYMQINAELNKNLSKLEEAYSKAFANSKNFTLDDAVLTLQGKKLSDKFADFAWNIHEEEAGMFAPSSARNERVNIRTFLDFAGDIFIQDINDDLVSRYSVYLHRKGLAKSSQYNKHKTIKKILNIAVRRGVIDKNPYFVNRISKGNTVSGRNGLEFSEIKQIENLNLEGDEINIIKDMFLFACYTGIRYSDLQNLKKTNVRLNDNGEKLLSFVMEKTKRYKGTPILLPLSKLFEGKPAQIIDAYLKRHSEYIFPRITNQHANRQLKLIQLFSGINQHLSTHIARHTFCSRLAEIKPDPYLIKQLAGHSDIRTSMIYIHQSKAALEKKLDDIDW